MNIQQTPTFTRRVKKLHNKEKKALDKAVKQVINDPSIGKMKKGDLLGIQVYKYKLVSAQMLLAYQVKRSGKIKTLILLALGSHENFYRDLKQ